MNFAECDIFEEGSRNWCICRGESGLSARKGNAYRESWGLLPSLAEEATPVTVASVIEAPVPELIFHGASVSAVEQRKSRYGPGSELLKIYEAAGAPHCDACYEMAQQMNRWGVAECRTRIEEIVADMLPRARAWLKNKAPWIMSLIPDTIEDFGICFKLRIDINKAINAAELAIAERRQQQELRAKNHVAKGGRGGGGCCGSKASSRVAARPRIKNNGRLPIEKMTPVLATLNGKRNLLWHLWPSKKSSNWKTAIEQLLRRMDVFNGVRSISVVTDSETASLAEVQAEFAGVRVDNWMTFPNNSKLREVVSFLPLMATLPDDNSVTFLGHGKSVRHHEGSICVGWAETQNRLLLDDIDSTMMALERFPIVGAFKRYGSFGRKCQHRWHYSGGAYWMRQADVFAKEGWEKQVEQWFGGTESWPGGVFPQTQAYCVGPNDVGDLYRPEAWEAMKPELDALFSVRDKLREGKIDDETFFAQSQWKGYTAWHWPPLVEAHTRVAVYLRDVLECHSVLEIGSGLGMFLVGAKAAGLKVMGFDRNALEREFAISNGVPEIGYTLAMVGDYTIRKPVDAIYTCEVFEHCTDEELAPLCRQIAANCKWFYFTSTPHRASDEIDKRQGHINIKSRDEWLTFFAQFGLTWDRDDASVCEWGMILKGQL